MVRRTHHLDETDRSPQKLSFLEYVQVQGQVRQIGSGALNLAIRNEASLGYKLLKYLAHEPSPIERENIQASEHMDGVVKLDKFLGRETWKSFAAGTVLDFGCGSGSEAIEVAAAGAQAVYGIDIQESLLERARENAARRGVSARCMFLHAVQDQARIQQLQGKFKYVYSLDAFEHFDKPENVLEQAYDFLAPGGRFLISFGPPWKHPYGGHMYFFTPLPWVQLLFAEKTVMAVRRLYRSDGATTYREVEGGLNQMTVARFLEIVGRSPFTVESLRLVPIKGINWLVRSRVSREYFTSIVFCVLLKPIDSAHPSGLPV